MTTTNYKTWLKNILQEERDGVLEYERLLISLKVSGYQASTGYKKIQEILADEKSHVRMLSKIL